MAVIKDVPVRGIDVDAIMYVSKVEAEEYSTFDLITEKDGVYSATAKQIADICGIPVEGFLEGFSL